MARQWRRDLKKEEFWQRMLRRRARSGLSVRAWCLKHHLQPSAFYWWRRKLDRCGATCRETVRRDVDRPGTAFVPLRLTEDWPAKTAPVIEILLTKGRRILLRGSVNRPMLMDVLAVLAEEPCSGDAGHSAAHNDRISPGHSREVRPC